MVIVIIIIVIEEISFVVRHSHLLSEQFFQVIKFSQTNCQYREVKTLEHLSSENNYLIQYISCQQRTYVKDCLGKSGPWAVRVESKHEEKHLYIRDQQFTDSATTATKNTCYRALRRTDCTTIGVGPCKKAMRRTDSRLYITVLFKFVREQREPGGCRVAATAWSSAESEVRSRSSTWRSGTLAGA